MFSENPLSLSVSDESFHHWIEETYAIPNAASVLRRSYFWNQLEHLTRHLPFRTLSLPNPQLTVEDLSKGPRPWLTDFLGITSTSGQRYSIPNNWDAGVRRFESNFVDYVGNYLIFLAVAMVLSL